MLELHTQRPRGPLEGVACLLTERIGRIVQGCHARDGGHGCLQHFELFGHEFSGAVIQPGEVAPGPGQTRYQTPFHQVGSHGNHDGNGRGGLLGRHHGLGRGQPDDVRRELDQLGGEGRESVGVVLGMAVCEADGVPLHIAQVAQALLEGLETGCRRL
jgi:hypothetical protein